MNAPIPAWLQDLRESHKLACEQRDALAEALQWIAAHEYDAHQIRDDAARALLTAMIGNARAALRGVQS